MNFVCGPEHDKRHLTFKLPSYEISDTQSPNYGVYLRVNRLKGDRSIGILLSGGLDSALLYYLLLKENRDIGNLFKITPYTILRKEGSRQHALGVINYINSLFNIESANLNVVGDNTLPEIKQVISGQNDVLLENDFVYVGIIEARPEHSIGWERPGFKEKLRVLYPFLNLQKSHIVDLICQNNLQPLFELTHSCAVHETDPCGVCNGCRERQWGLEQMNLPTSL